MRFFRTTTLGLLGACAGSVMAQNITSAPTPIKTACAIGCPSTLSFDSVNCACVATTTAPFIPCAIGGCEDDPTRPECSCLYPPGQQPTRKPSSTSTAPFIPCAIGGCEDDPTQPYCSCLYPPGQQPTRKPSPSLPIYSNVAANRQGGAMAAAAGAVFGVAAALA